MRFDFMEGLIHVFGDSGLLGKEILSECDLLLTIVLEDLLKADHLDKLYLPLIWGSVKHCGIPIRHGRIASSVPLLSPPFNRAKVIVDPRGK